MLREINAVLRAQRIPPRMTRLNLDLDAALNQPGLFTLETVPDLSIAALRDKVRGGVL